MSHSTLFSALGVSLILLVFLSSLLNKISQTSLVYWFLNLVGDILATIGAALISTVLFVVMEVAWVGTSVMGLAKWKKAVLGNH